VTTTPARFLIPRPEDSDTPDGPADFNAAMDVVDNRLRYAGAQGGKSIVATEQSRTNTAYGLLGTPDRVQSLVLPTDGIIIAVFLGLWKCSADGVGRAAMFLGSNQLKGWRSTQAAEEVQEARGGFANNYSQLTSFAGGLAASESNIAPTADTTGRILGFGQAADVGNAYMGSTDILTGAGFFGGACMIEADAGTYDLSVQFAATSGTVTAKERKLWVWTREFPSSGV
jgi:hypothetical protein